MLDQDQVLNYLSNSAGHQQRTSKVSYERRSAKQVRERIKHGVTANLAYSRYDLVRTVVQESGFLIKDDEDLADATFLI